SSSSSSSPSP
ncbi:hypothetical protein CFC21_094847, partial [Triticum aestivum]